MGKDLFPKESENAFLSILLNHPHRIYDIKYVKPHMMSSSANVALLDQMIELAEDGSVPDKDLLEEYLIAKGKISSIGGMDTVKYLISLDYDKNNFDKYEDLIVKSYKARNFIAMVSDSKEKLNSVLDIDRVISDLKTGLDNLSTSHGGSKTTDLTSVLEEVYDEIEKRSKNPGIRGFTTGYQNVDIYTGGINPGDLIIIGSRPSMGKSALMCNMALRQAKEGVGVLMFEYEMPRQALIERLVSIETGINLLDIRLGNLNESKVKEIKRALVDFEGLPIFLDTSYITDPTYAFSTVRRYQKISNIGVVYFDYIQLMVERDSQAVHELGRLTRSAKLLANELNIGIVFLSQLNRTVESRDDKRPMLADLRQSGNLEEDADLMVALYRDIRYNPKNIKDKDKLEYIIRKQRNGPIGIIPMKFDESTNKVV